MASTFVVPAPTGSAPRLWTVAEYDRLPDDLFSEERVELIEGRIYTKMGQGFAPVTAIRLISRALRAAFGESFDVSTQLPIQLGDSSKPEPDVLVLRGRAEEFDGRYPDPASEIALIVEVSDTSLADDQDRKARRYAKHGIPEYWILNIQDRTLEVRRGPRSASETRNARLSGRRTGRDRRGNSAPKGRAPQNGLARVSFSKVPSPPGVARLKPSPRQTALPRSCWASTRHVSQRGQT